MNPYVPRRMIPPDPNLPLLHAECSVCGEEFRAAASPQARVSHRCPRGTAGAVWTVWEPQAVTR